MSNEYNGLMQAVQNSLEIGRNAVERVCPDRLYNPLVPVAGTLLQRSETAMSTAKRAVTAHLSRQGVS
jgi:hypothetical protein